MVGDFDTKRITVGQALRDILRIPYTTGTTTWNDGGSAGETKDGLLSVRDIETDSEILGHWTVLYGSIGESGSSTSAQVLDNLKAGYDFDQLELRKGYSLLLAYIEDDDGDGVSSREEFLYGTSDSKSDTDGDGLTDFEEVRHGWTIPVARMLTRDVFSDPLNPDVDEDGLTELMASYRSFCQREPIGGMFLESVVEEMLDRVKDGEARMERLCKANLYLERRDNRRHDRRSLILSR
jgi:hypothetical protein